MRKMRVLLSGVTYLLTLAVTCFGAGNLRSDPPKTNNDLKVRLGETVTITKSHRYCWFPNVSQLSTGEIIVGFFMNPDETHPEGYFSGYCISSDGGRTWGPRFTAGHGFDNNTFNHISPKDGTQMRLWFYIYPSPPEQMREFETIATTVSEGGRLVTHRRGIRVSLPQPVRPTQTRLYETRQSDGGQVKAVPHMSFYGPILESTDGSLLVTMYGKFEGDELYRCVLLRSKDAGKSWQYVSTVAQTNDASPRMGKEGPNEPAMVRLADGRLLCIMRTGGGSRGEGPMFQTWSTDEGRTWSKPVSAGVEGVSPRLRLLSNGVLACTYGRPGPVSIMFSLDGSGKSWSHHTPLFDGKSSCYTDMIEVSPSCLLVVYDHVPYGWKSIPHEELKSLNTIYGVFVEVQQ
jgi:hypothetical protein